MKITHKKLVSGLFVGLLIATVGAAFATGQLDDTTDDAINREPLQMPFGERHRLGNNTTNVPPLMPFGNMIGPFASELTEEQQTELEDLMITLREQNASFDEIRTAIQEKLDEFGVLDIQLDNEIAQTEQRLTILNRQKELRNEGYSWDEINDIIKDEFDLENTTGFNCEMRGGPRCEQGPQRCPQDLMAGEDFNQ